MRKVITKLAEKANLNLSQFQASMRIENKPYQRLCIEQIDTNLISVAHYFEMNGDLVPDPDMVFLILDSYWYPISFQSQIMYEESVKYDADGQIATILSGMKSMVSFASTWAENIIAQGYLEAVKPIGNADTE